MSTYDALRVAQRAGAVCGLALGSLAMIQFMLALAGLNADAQRDLSSAIVLASFVAYFLIGLIVRRRTASLEAAMRAGVVSAVIAGAMMAAGTAVLDAFAPNVVASSPMQLAPAAVGVGATLFAGLLNLVVLAAIGAGLALVGALAGRPKTAAPFAHSPTRIRGHLGR